MTKQITYTIRPCDYEKALQTEQHVWLLTMADPRAVGGKAVLGFISPTRAKAMMDALNTGEYDLCIKKRAKPPAGDQPVFTPVDDEDNKDSAPPQG